MCCAARPGRSGVAEEGGKERCTWPRLRLHRWSVTSLALPEAGRGPGWVFFRVWSVPGSFVGEHLPSLPRGQPFSFEGARCILSPKSGVSFGLALCSLRMSVAELLAFPRQCLPGMCVDCKRVSLRVPLLFSAAWTAFSFLPFLSPLSPHLVQVGLA